MQKVKTNLKTFLKKLPSKPGVYFFYGQAKKLLYIGKAKNLKKRIASYFAKKSNLSPAKQIMVQKIKSLAYQTTSSEITALLKEAHLIKKLKPRFNIAFRDDVFYPYIQITQEKYPRIFITRKKEDHTSFYLGPFVRSRDAHLALRTLRSIFPFRSCKNLPNRPCLDYYIKLCPGVCANIENKRKNLSSKDIQKIYQNNIKQAIRFLQGKNKTILLDLKKQMQRAAQKKKYELAQEFRDQLQALKQISKHKKFLLKDSFQITETKQKQIKKEFKKFLGIKKFPQRIEAYDISNIQGKFAVGSMVVFSRKKGAYQPQKNQYRRFKIKTVQGISDVEMLKEVLERRLKHPEWPKADLILVDGGPAQLNTACQALYKNHCLVPVLALAKKEEKLYLLKQKKPLRLSLGSPLLHLFQSLRDEAHRFALAYYRLRHEKGIYKQSVV